MTSIFGSELAEKPASSSGAPLARTLEGTQVLVNGIAAPLYYVSEHQINFQIPFETPVNKPVSIVAIRNGVVIQAANGRRRLCAGHLYVPADCRESRSHYSARGRKSGLTRQASQGQRSAGGLRYRNWRADEYTGDWCGGPQQSFGEGIGDADDYGRQRHC